MVDPALKRTDCERPVYPELLNLAGGEEVYIHAEKDKNVIVENDRTEDVGRDETISIHRHRWSIWP